MSISEIAEAKRMLAKLSLPVKPLPSRRAMVSPRGRIDPARSLRAALRRGGEMERLAFKRPRPRYPNLVVLCDISGSMSQYSRVILHFLHAVSNARGAGWARVHAFTFGTRLTNITRHLATRDVDAALKAAGAEAQGLGRRHKDRRLSGGLQPRLVAPGHGAGSCRPVDHRWFGSGGAREPHAPDAAPGLTARRLIWLNPLLRWEGFAAKAAGIKAMLPHVDSFRAGHSIASLEELAAVISAPEDVGEKARLMQALSD